MTFAKAKEQVEKAITEYDDGVITMGALMEVVRVTFDELADAVADYLPDMADDDEEVLFEGEIDLDVLREDYLDVLREDYDKEVLFEGEIDLDVLREDYDEEDDEL